MLRVVATVVMLTLYGVSPCQAQPRSSATQKTYVCPLCRTHAHATGHDGRSAPRRYSDLEVPTRAYTNLVVACPKCGYAAWADDFSRFPMSILADYTRRNLGKTAKRASMDPKVAYQHLVNLLYVARAPVAQQALAARYYTYVLKRRRRYGGMNAKLERAIVKARQRVLKLLALQIGKSPGGSRADLERQYLRGELKRLTGDPAGGLLDLQSVCMRRKQVGYTIGRLACEMATRAERGETFEDYRDGVTDMRNIETAERQAKEQAKRAQREAEARKKEAEATRRKVEEELKRRRKAQKPSTPPPTVPTPPPSKKDPYAPPPPPVAR